VQELDRVFPRWGLSEIGPLEELQDFHSGRSAQARLPATRAEIHPVSASWAAAQVHPKLGERPVALSAVPKAAVFADPAIAPAAQFVVHSAPH
jgi:hypothetical protein